MSKTRSPLAVAAAGLAVVAALSAPLPARAALFTVGPGGTHATIQAALDAALAAPPGAHEIRVHRGTYDENLMIPAGAEPLDLVVRGGWNDGYLTSTANPSDTAVDAGRRGRALQVGRREAGRLRLEALTLRAGRAFDPRPLGGNLDLEAGGVMALEISNCDFRGGDALGDGAARVAGGGLAARLFDKATLSLELLRFHNNRSELRTGIGIALGGGAYLELHDDAELRATGIAFDGNSGAVPALPSSLSGVGFFLETFGASTADLDGVELFDNSAVEATGVGAVLIADDQSAIGLHSLVAIGNSGTSSAQLILQSYDDASLRAGDSIVGPGGAVGMYVYLEDRATLDMTGWTVTQQEEIGGSFTREPTATGRLAIYNSIFWQNGSDLELDGAVDAAANLVGVDPLFVDAAGENYNLASGSPAIDAGENHPPGGLWGTDFAGATRLQGPRVDRGAYETAGPPHHDGGEFPLCRVLSPQGTPPGSFELPIPAFTNVCTCLGDYGLNEFRCLFRLVDVELVARFPRFFAPGEPLPVRWAIHPWGEIRGPYAMSAEAEVGGQWIPQTWLGPTAGKLHLDKIVVEPFEVKPGVEGRTPLRTTLSYRRADGKWANPLLELVLPAPVSPPQ